MLSNAMSSLGRSLILADADIYARFAMLFLVGVAGIVTFYWSLIATVQILARDAGTGLDDNNTPVALSLAVLLGVGLAPIIRFVVSDLPDLARDTVRENGHYLLMGVVLAVSCVVLLLA
jgi:hypothetical protein